mmetsp:Transcript_19251/g.48912  ORF Transcript_19251/g.48912 Transcript_19251/m.48912 type:complete len:482 (-) Transcript_19251:1330-2775(-)
MQSMSVFKKLFGGPSWFVEEDSLRASHPDCLCRGSCSCNYKPLPQPSSPIERSPSHSRGDSCSSSPSPLDCCSPCAVLPPQSEAPSSPVPIPIKTFFADGGCSSLSNVSRKSSMEALEDTDSEWHAVALCTTPSLSTLSVSPRAADSPALGASPHSPRPFSHASPAAFPAAHARSTLAEVMQATCPICCACLHGLSNDAINLHIDQCLATTASDVPKMSASAPKAIGMARPKKTATKGSIVCPFYGCGMMMDLPNFYAHALGIHTTNLKQPLMCPYCAADKNTTKYTDLLGHLKDQHGKDGGPARIREKRREKSGGRATVFTRDQGALFRRAPSESLPTLALAPRSSCLQFAGTRSMHTEVAGPEEEEADASPSLPPSQDDDDSPPPRVLRSRSTTYTPGEARVRPWNSLKDLPKEMSYIVYTQATDLEMECPICLCEFYQGEQVARLQCLCLYHLKCIQEWHARCAKEHRSKSCTLHVGH